MSEIAGVDEVYDRPGFKIRRCHQIATSIFHEECGDLDLTTTQLGTLMVLRQNPGIEQIAVARLLGFDRSTTALVMSLLEKRGLIRRQTARGDKRRRELYITDAAIRLIDSGAAAMERARQRLLAPLDAGEQVAFMAALDKLLDAFNTSTRVPLMPGRE